MNRAPDKIYGWINPPLGLLAAFNIALTLYGCTQFYAYLPTSDTWIYVDFLVQAAQGQLDLGTLFEKHNGVHVIALPKLVYFLDAWLMQGRGVLTVVISLLAQVASLLLFFSVIQKIAGLQQREKVFLNLASTIFLLSACQAESLLNPANLQWSLLVFSATFTAWCVFHYSKTKSVKWLVGIAFSIALVGMTSASPFLMLMPLAIIFMPAIPLKKIALASLLLLLVAGSIFAPTMLKNLFSFGVAFMAPPVERLHSLPITLLTGVLLALAIWKALDKKAEKESGENTFFKLLLYFSLFLIFATGVVRATSPSAFTFRFVNIGLLFSLTLFIYLYLQATTQRMSTTLMACAIAYMLLLSCVNYKEISAFGYGRNHIHLNQVAYSLDVQDSFVVSALPGTIWEKPDYEFVQANKHKLAEHQLGIYSDPAYQLTGTPITALIEQTGQMTTCRLEVSKMRRLLPGQAAYKLTGTAQDHEGRKLSQVYFADSDNIIRGFAIPILSSRDLWQGFRQGQHWSGFVNLDKSTDAHKLRAYAYGDGIICEPQVIELPAYQPFIKKENRN